MIMALSNKVNKLFLSGVFLRFVCLRLFGMGLRAALILLYCWGFGGVSGEIPFFLKSDVCYSPNCGEITKNIQSSLNHTVKPCNDFYQYSCGSFALNTNKPPFEAFWNHFLSTSYKINRKIQNILEASTNRVLKKPQMFYQACINMHENEHRYLAHLKLIIDYFKGWPIANDTWNFMEYDWLEEIIQITKIVGIYPILKFHVNVDYKDTTKYALYIEPGVLIFPQHVLLNPKLFKAELNAYKTWILETVKYLYPNRATFDVELEVSRIVEFEIKLARLMSGRGRIEKISVEKLSRRFGKYFLKDLNLLFDDRKMKLKPVDTVNIKNYGYFRNLMGFLKTVEQKDIANYLIWSIVKELSREVSNHLQNLNFLVNKAVLTLSTDLPKHIECTNRVTQYFSLAILPQYIDKYVDKNIISDINVMVESIKNSFIKVLEETEWLSLGTKELAVGKVRNMKTLIGYPSWIENEGFIEEYYRTLNISDDHLLNMLMAKAFKIEQNLLNLNKTVESVVWPTNPFDVNSYYSVLQNAIFIPLGILQPPFYYQNGPHFFNYGALGSLIGHEISHSLDTTGRQANMHGIILKWWPQVDIFNYQSKAKCFERKFDAKSILAVGENIADSVGLKISYKAFEKLEGNSLSFEDKKRELFFISYAQMWCEISDQIDLFTDEHTLVQNRVNKTVLNNEEFNEIFQCNKNISDLNCNLWY